MENTVELEGVALDSGDFYEEYMHLTLTFRVSKSIPGMEAVWSPYPFGYRTLDEETKEKVLALVTGREGHERLPKPTKVIYNEPETTVFWADGKKTVAVARPGDGYDPITGAIICAYRKVTGNRRSTDGFEFTADELAGLRCASDLRAVAGVLGTDANLDMVLSESMYELSTLDAEERGVVSDTLTVAAGILELGEA